MIRLLVILIVAGLIATGLAWMADLQGGLDMVLGSYAIHMSVGAAAGLLLVAVGIIFVFFRVLMAVLSTPETLGEWSRARRARHGYQALSRGLVAAAAGDSQEAKRFAKQGEKLLGEAPLGLLLKAQAAQLDGNEEIQTSSYRAMLEHSETEFLGLRGLFMQAMRKGNEDEAIKFATRANVLKPKAAWASHALFDLHAGRHEWDSAQAILKKQVRARLTGGDVARRRRAVILAAAAIDADKAGDDEAALSSALEAVGLAPSLIPAATLAARKLTKAGRTWKAQDIVEAAWAQAPHPDLSSAYATLHPNDDPSARARRMKALVQLNPNHVESRLVVAEQAIAQAQWFDARSALEPLTRGFPTARACLLMAEIAQAERGDVTAAQGWLARAARSPRDAQWRCGHCGFVMQDWTSICSNCDAFDSLSWVAPRTDTIEALPPGAALTGMGTIVDATAIEAPQGSNPAGAPAALNEPLTSLQRLPDDPGIVEGNLAESLGGHGSEHGEEYEAFSSDESKKTEDSKSPERNS
jgi:HemY protein